MYLKLLYKIVLILSTTLFVAACTSHDSEVNTAVSTPHLVLKPIQYSKRFSVAESQDLKVLFLFGNRNSQDTTSVFVLYKNEKPTLQFKNVYYVKVPVITIASMSSIYGAMLSKLNLADKIVAIESADYYNDSLIISRVKSGKIKELAKGPELNVEQTLLLNPELILTFGMGDPRTDVNSKILNSNIPVAISLDHLEEHPLARAEWIKFIAYFFDKEQLADSLFNVTVKNYNTLMQMCDTLHSKPSVLTEIKYADAWYVPGGKSFMSNLIADAGGMYLWKDEEKSGSIPLSFEQVYTKAKDADYWINLFININSKKDLLAFDERYHLFKAFQSGNLFNNTRVVNSKGYSNYWETGMTNPDELLKDLIKILHPQLLPDYQLKYYKKIN